MTSEEPEQTRILREILKWIRFSSMKEVKAALQANLETPQKKLIYHLSDGSRGSVDIAKAVGVSDWTVRNYWRLWSKVGLVEPLKSGRGDRFRRSFDLGDFGVEIPKTREVTEQDVNSDNVLLDTSPSEGITNE
ncbi:MAG: hypothetical protein JRN34_04995 [Nitrososphaerota archaeon]|nr:hypothetical protein [Nitrososphaerota archaeon]MDG6942265.1 hypothetical protein [Nitrososphaerota archaeon]MDG6942730.1 hypothetical protein [Nitrososphaerota archaeon]MDG6948517.1 hypothetical protein [Nitrososphaerota archaeon]MDG6950443.1 hypothetical protein [Nitrososphaerota archaeon]